MKLYKCALYWIDYVQYGPSCFFLYTTSQLFTIVAIVKNASHRHARSMRMGHVCTPCILPYLYTMPNYSLVTQFIVFYINALAASLPTISVYAFYYHSSHHQPTCHVITVISSLLPTFTTMILQICMPIPHLYLSQITLISSVFRVLCHCHFSPYQFYHKLSCQINVYFFCTTFRDIFACV